MTLRISGEIGRIRLCDVCVERPDRSEHILHLASLLEQERGRIVLDLKEVTIVGREAIRFLAAWRNERICTQELSGLCTRVDPSRKIQRSQE